MPDPEILAGVLPVVDSALTAARQFDPEAFNALDEDYPPSTLLAPLPADTGQLKAVAITDAGDSFLLQGGPYSGKQQALLNVLAHSLAHGRQVLLVTPPARLQASGRGSLCQQLEQLGLMSFCLRLPEPDSVDAEAPAPLAQVLGQLQQSLALPLRRHRVEQQTWSTVAYQLQHLTQALNERHQALYTRHPNGLSVWEAVMRLIAHAQWTPVLLPLVPEQLSRVQVQQLQQRSQQLQAILQPLLEADPARELEKHPLQGMQCSRFNPDWQRSLHHALLQLQQASAQLLTRAETAFPLLGLPASLEALNNLPLAAYAAAHQLLEALREAPKVPRGLVLHAHDAAMRRQLLELYNHGLQRDLCWARLGGKYRDELGKQLASTLRQEWLAIAAYAWPRRVYERNRFFQNLRVYRTDQQTPEETEIPELLEVLAQLNREDHWLQQQQTQMMRWLQSDPAVQRGRWSELASHINWAGRYADALELVGQQFARPVAQLLEVVLPLLAEERGRLLPDCGIGGAFLRYGDAWQHLDSLRQRVAGLAEAQVLLLQGDREPEGLLRLQNLARNWLAAEAQWEIWCRWQATREQALGEGLRPFLQAVERGRVPVQAMPQFMRYCICHHWLPQGIARLPEALRNFDGHEQESLQQGFLLAESSFQDLARQVMLAQLYTRLPDDYALIQDGLLPEDPVLAELHQLFLQPPATLQLKMLLRLFPKLIPQLKPCVLASPEAVAAWLTPEAASSVPLAFGHFDLLLVQDAGTITLEALLPALRKTGQFLLAGDPARATADSALAYGQKLALPDVTLRHDYRPATPAMMCAATVLSATSAEAASPLVTAILRALQQAGWTAHPLQRCAGAVPAVDLAVVDPQHPQRYLLGILCDLPPPARITLTAREREIQRQQILAAQGWPLYRIWTLDWWRDSPGELQRLLDYLYSLLHLPEGHTLPPVPDRNADKTGAARGLDLAAEFANDLNLFAEAGRESGAV